MNTVKCPVCGTDANFKHNMRTFHTFYECPVCGRFELGDIGVRSEKYMNRLPSYLIYHRFDISDASELRFNTSRLKRSEEPDNADGGKDGGFAVYFDEETVDVWYPKTFAEKVDNILLLINDRSRHIGQSVKFTEQELYSMLFVDRYERKNEYSSLESRSNDDCAWEAFFMLNYLKEQNYISCDYIPVTHQSTTITLKPDGLMRVETLQRDANRSRNVFVAMQFGEETKPLREAIRNGITQAGYIPIFIDEVHHNNFINDELLKNIRDCKFMVAELTHQNNGAYFEEGYAMGLKKPVIQLCQKNKKLHFDIAQMNTIMWKDIEEIPDRLCNRIKATIE